jgi:hypothetical protein
MEEVNIMSSLLEEAQELIEMSLDIEEQDTEYVRKARVWLEKAKTTYEENACHEHDEGTTCSTCGFDLSCPACGH